MNLINKLKKRLPEPTGRQGAFHYDYKPYDESFNTCLSQVEEALPLIVEDVLGEVINRAPGLQNTKTGEVSYDLGVMEWKARIEALLSDLKKDND